MASSSWYCKNTAAFHGDRGRYAIELKRSELTFRNQTELKEFCRDIQHYKDQEIDSDHVLYPFLMDMFERHPCLRDQSKSVNGFQLMSKSNPALEDPLFPKEQFRPCYRYRGSEKWYTFALIKCVTSRDTSSGVQHSKAYRGLIRNQIERFRKRQVHACSNCSNTQGRMEVDHILPLKELIAQFESIHGRYDTVVRDGFHYQFLSKEVNKTWKRWHKKNATLRLLCQSCHTTRTRKGTPPKCTSLLFQHRQRQQAKKEKKSLE